MKKIHRWIHGNDENACRNECIRVCKYVVSLTWCCGSTKKGILLPLRFFLLLKDSQMNQIPKSNFCTLLFFWNFHFFFSSIDQYFKHLFVQYLRFRSDSTNVSLDGRIPMIFAWDWPFSIYKFQIEYELYEMRNEF